MRFARVRSGLAESIHDVAVVALDHTGAIAFASGDTDIPFFYRSSIKPFQALAAARAGVRLPAEHLAVTCSSHGGWPVHLAIVEQILTDHGLTTDDLQCPPGWPFPEGARDLLVRGGLASPQRIHHNCSGKHAGWLAACQIAGWDTVDYLAPDHPIQRSVRDIVADVTGCDPEPVGVDGCGAPTLRGTLEGLGTAFLRLTTDDDLAPMNDAMTRFGALIADNTSPWGRVAITWGHASKIGAEGVYGVATSGGAIAAKSAEGDAAMAVAAIVEAADRLGVMPDAVADRLADVRRPPVLGGGATVGHLELVDA